MVKLNPRRVDHENYDTPILYDREIDEYAHAVLKDYKPLLLKEPGKINFQHFLESYLGASIEYHDIFNDDPERPILAMTIYGSGEVKVFNRENGCVSRIKVPERTVIIDNAVMYPGKEGLALFSGIHEGGHIAMHWDVYSKILEDEVESSGYNASAVYCRRDNIEYIPKGNTKMQKRTAEEWREHQADYFAAAIAMPNITFMPFVRSILRENGYYKPSITIGRDEDLDILADDIIPDAISEVYGVSRRAARIKLRKLGFVNNNAR